MASYQKRPNGWEVSVFLGRDPLTGKKLRKTKGGFKTKKEAQNYASQLNVDVQNGLNIVTNKILLKDFLTEWFNNHVVRNFSINTVTGYKTRIETHINPYLGDMQLSKINSATIQKFYYSLIDKGLQPSTCKKIIETLTSCFKYAKKMNLVSNIPTDIEKLKGESTSLEVWDAEELKYFLSEIKDTYLYVPILIISLTGLRIAELCGLRWENVDLENAIIHVREQVIQDKRSKVLVHTNDLKTPTSYRSITIPDSLVTVLKASKPIQQSTMVKDFVILSRDGHMCNPRNLSMDFSKKVAKYKNLPKISIHGLRHTHATILVKKRENIKVISERLGHSSDKTTLDIYSHVLPSMKKETAELLDTLFLTQDNVQSKSIIKFEENFDKVSWTAFDISDEMNNSGLVELRSYSEILDEEREIATVVMNDIDIDEKRADLALMLKAPEMFRLLKSSYEQFSKSGNTIMANKIEKLLTDICEKNIKIYSNEAS